MAKEFPADGMGLNSFPALPRTTRITFGPSSDNNVQVTTTGVYHLMSVAAGTVVHEVATSIETAFTASVALTVGDSDDVDGYLTDTVIKPDTTSVTAALVSTKVSGGVYASGKYYAAAHNVDLVISGATAVAGQGVVFITASMAGLES